MTKILVVGGGGREHAIGWKLNKPDTNLYFAPGNAGTALLGINLDKPNDPNPANINDLARFASENKIDLTVVGPEGPLADGIVNQFNRDSLKIFGPTQSAAKLETSKAFAAEFMQHHNIPSPDFHVSRTVEDALIFVESPPWKMVIKADGLASGKGVILPDSKKEAVQTVQQIMQQQIFGEAGKTIVFQERLNGPEVSVLAFTDGNSVVPLLPAQDHKRIFAGDQGPNTGGMGAYTPVPLVSPELIQQIHSSILQPTVDGMREEGNPYKGILYAGLMLTDQGPKVLEYNARFGDPETQPLMMLLQSDLAPVLLSCIDGSLRSNQVEFSQSSAVCVVMAAEGYPKNPKTGEIIHGLGSDFGAGIQIFQAGTIKLNENTITKGGRVLGVTARGLNLEQALQRAYSVIGPQGIHFEGMQYRNDIAANAIKK